TRSQPGGVSITRPSRSRRRLRPTRRGTAWYRVGRRSGRRRGRRLRTQTLSSSSPISRTCVLVGSSLASPARTWPSWTRSTTAELRVTKRRAMRAPMTGAASVTMSRIASTCSPVMSIPKAIRRRRRAPTMPVMTAAETTGSFLTRFLTFTSLLAMGVPEEGGLGEDEIEEGVGTVGRLAPKTLDDRADTAAEGAVLLRELAIGLLERLDAPAVFGSLTGQGCDPCVLAGDLGVLSLCCGDQAREAGIEALRLRLLLEILALLAVRPEAPEDHEGVADAGEDRAAAEGLGDWGDEVRHYSPPANP